MPSTQQQLAPPSIVAPAGKRSAGAPGKSIAVARNSSRAVAGPLATLQRKAAALAGLARRGIVAEAVSAAGIPRETYTSWLKNDPKFAEAAHLAQEQAYDTLESEAWRRAVDGWDEPVYQGGKLVGTLTKRSDTLLIFMLKGGRPMKYRDNSPITNINASGPVQVNLNV